MYGWSIKDSQREERIIQVLGFIFLFKVVMVKDLDLLGSSVLGINSMRRTVEYLKRRKMIDRFVTSTPLKTSGYWLLEAGLKRLPKSLLSMITSFRRHGLVPEDWPIIPVLLRSVCCVKSLLIMGTGLVNG